MNKESTPKRPFPKGIPSGRGKRTKELSRFLRSYVLASVMFAIFIAGFLIGRSNQEPIVEPVNGGEVIHTEDTPEFLSKDVDFNLFWDVWELLSSEFVDQPVNEAELLYGAIRGMAASLGDPHTLFLDPELTQEFNADLQGNFEGIGAEIAVKNDQLQIVAPLPDTPAERAGIKAGDKILQIDGENTAGITVMEAVTKIRGEGGTEVVLTITRDGLEDVQDISVIRDTIHVVSVKWEMLPEQIAHIELRAFNHDTEDEFKKIVKEILNSNPKGIILDLRSNPGGLLDTAIEVTSEWVESGVVVSEKFYNGLENEHKARGRAQFKDFTTVVLINEGSASGAEIVAGALKDYGLATLIGMQSFGKGSVQTLYDFSEGSSLKLTIAKWLTPNGATIDGEGITPDIEIDLTDEDWDADIDPQLDKAIELLNY